MTIQHARTGIREGKQRHEDAHACGLGNEQEVPYPNSPAPQASACAVPVEPLNWLQLEEHDAKRCFLEHAHTHTHTHTHTQTSRARAYKLARTHSPTQPHTHTHTHMQRRVERARHTTDKLNVGSVSGQRYNDPPSRLPTKQAGTKSIAEHHREVEEFNEGWVQCGREGCNKWRKAPEYANSYSDFECKMVVEKGCRGKEDDWVTEVEAFCPQARGDKVASEPSFSQKPYCEVAIRHLLHNISSRTPSFWRGVESTDDLIVKASTAETVSLEDRVDILKQIFFALTKSINKECKGKYDEYWKDIDTKINEVCHAPVCVSTH